MFQTHDGILKLSVHDNTVSTDDDIVEDISVQGVMQRGQAIGEPCYFVGLAATCGMLKKIVP